MTDTTPDNHVTDTTADSKSNETTKSDEECSSPVLEGTLILGHLGGSDTELEVERKVKRIARSNTVTSDSALLQPSRSSPIHIVVSYIYMYMYM